MNILSNDDYDTFENEKDYCNYWLPRRLVIQVYVRNNFIMKWFYIQSRIGKPFSRALLQHVVKIYLIVAVHICLIPKPLDFLKVIHSAIISVAQEEIQINVIFTLHSKSDLFLLNCINQISIKF